MIKRLLAICLLVLTLVIACSFVAQAKDILCGNLGATTTATSITVTINGKQYTYTKGKNVGSHFDAGCKVPVGQTTWTSGSRDSGHYCCYNNAQDLYKSYWGKTHSGNSENFIDSRPMSECRNTEENMKKYLRFAEPGALVTVGSYANSAAHSHTGHTVIFLGFDDDGIWIINTNGHGYGLNPVEYVAWNYLPKYLSSAYPYIICISWPGAASQYETRTAHTHNWTDWTITKNASCAAAGEKARSCKICAQTEKQSIAALPHTMISYNAKKATCGSEGWDAYQQCSVCGYSTKVVIKLNHDWYSTPSEYKSGSVNCVAVYHCKNDWSHITTNIIDHIWDRGVVIKPATCSTSGSTLYTCQNCKGTWTQTIPATGIHTPNAGVVTTKPTGTTTGIITYMCTTCGKNYTEVLPADCIYTFDGTTLRIPNAKGINYIRFTKGVFTDSDSLRQAPHSSLNTTYIAQNTDSNGTFSYSVPSYDTYTFWVRYNAADGSVNGPTYMFTITFDRFVSLTANPFTDVRQGKWYLNGVLYCYGKGYVSGTSQTTFSPANNLTRRDFVTILANMMCGDLSKYANVQTFSDVPKGAWYHNAVEWAVANGITSGTGVGKFSPKNELTRQELAVLLYNVVGKPNASGSLSSFGDATSVSSWAKNAMSWAVGQGLLSGANGKCMPKGIATRAQAAVIIMNFDKNVMMAF